MTRKEIISKLSREHYTFGYAPGNIHPATVRVSANCMVVGRRVLASRPDGKSEWVLLSGGVIASHPIFLGWTRDIEALP